MNLEGPDRYYLTFDASTGDACTVRSHLTGGRFSGLAVLRVPKVYVVVRDHWPIYVGTTVQRMGTRLRYGFTARGEGGYHGYEWRKQFKDAVLDVWCPRAEEGECQPLDAETIEAELVFLIRQAGQWPLFQTEIHFHESSQAHRAVASRIFEFYRGGASKLFDPRRDIAVVTQSTTVAEKQALARGAKGTAMTRSSQAGGKGRTTVPGFVNRNDQRNDGPTGRPGTDHNSELYRMKCLKPNCGWEYEANGTDIHHRRCPKCQRGAPSSGA
jgi:hypothetical protein